MAIRNPQVRVLGVNNSEVGSGPASTAGGVAYAFNLPQDTDNVVVKFRASVLAGGVSATFQTSDDGGSTWYDVQRTSIVSNANAQNAEWLSIPVVGTGAKTGRIVASTVATGSVIAVTSSVYTTIGAAAASTLGVNEISGLPILGIQNRVFLRYTAGVTSVISEGIDVLVNNQSASA